MASQLFTVVSLLVVCLLACADCQMSSSGSALSAFSPCSNNFVLMERETGRSPSKDNYWKGTFNLANFDGLTDGNIVMTLDSQSVISVDGEVARITSDDKTFTFSTYNSPKVPSSLSFEVNAPASTPFPNIVSVTLNGENVCKNPQAWHPQIQQVVDLAGGVSE